MGEAIWDTPGSSPPPSKGEPLPKYRQITSHERYVIAALRRQRLSLSAIARHVGRSPSTISREIRRNLSTQGRYSPPKADSYAVARRRRSRRNSQFSAEDWEIVEQLIGLDWSPQQVSGWLARHGVLSISHETIYLRVWRDKRGGGSLWTHMRQSSKKRRKRNGSHDSRGRLAGKRHISERPAEAEGRRTIGHWEMGKLERHCAADANAATIELICRQRASFKTITADNGTEFHSYRDVEAATGVPYYFATPHHSWERGTNENTNGLIRQYLPKRTSQAHVTQADCDAIAAKLNSRPRKRLGYRTPEECYAQAR